MRIEGWEEGSWEKVARRWASWGEAARRRRGGGGVVGREEEEGVAGVVVVALGEGDIAEEGLGQRTGGNKERG